MAVILARVDNRLIHGQVLEGWVPHLGVDLILVVGSRESADPMQRALLEALATPALGVRVVDPREAADVVAAEDSRHRILLLFPQVDDACAAYESGLRFRRLNLGNLHPRRGSHAVTHSVFLTAEDERELRMLARKGVEIEARAVPSDRSPALVEILGSEEVR